MDLRYPIGRFQAEGPKGREQQMELINQIDEAPLRLREAISGLTPEQLDTPYRPDGWTVRQVVHHLPDSHLNSYIRFKWALTEDEPVIKPYDEVRWAELEDARTGPPEVSLALLEALHKRWVLFLRFLTADDMKHTYVHPQLGVMTVERTLASYAWHGRHHVAHITSLRERMGW